MRAAKILVAVLASFFIGSTPVSSLNVSRDQPRACAPWDGRAISLVGSASGIALISSDRCSE